MSSFTTILKNPAVRAKRWWIVDAHSHRVGRLASQLPKLLTGKYKPSWHPSMDCGDYVVIVNAKHVQFSGSKWDHKYYTWHTGWAGGLKRKNARIMKEQNPGMILRKAILRMIKKTPIRRRFANRLLIFPEGEHPFADKNLEEFIPTRSYNPTAYDTFYPEVDNVYTLELEKLEDGRISMSANLGRATPIKDSREVRVQRALLKEGGDRGKTKGNANPLEGFTQFGPRLSLQEKHFIKKLVDTGYKGENWPVQETSQQLKDITKMQQDFVDKVHKTHERVAEESKKINAEMDAIKVKY